MEDIEHIKKLLDMCKDDDGEYDFVQINITCEDLTAIENILNRLECVKTFIAGKKRDYKNCVGKYLKKTTVINCLSDIEEITLGEEEIGLVQDIEKVINRLEQLEKENKKLERKYLWRKSMYDRVLKENEFWKEYKEKLDKLDTKDFIFKHELEDYIPKSVIREKVKELENNREAFRDNKENSKDLNEKIFWHSQFKEMVIAINVLKELLD